MDQEANYEKKPAKKWLSYRKRCFGMTGLERIQVKEKLLVLEEFQKVKAMFADDSGSDIEEIFDDFDDFEEGILQEIRDLEAVDPRIHEPQPPIERRYRTDTIDSFEDTEIRQLFRFESKEQLHRLLTGFDFPNEIRHSSQGNKFTGEEVMLCGIL